jgi:zinc protease
MKKTLQFLLMVLVTFNVYAQPEKTNPIHSFKLRNGLTLHVKEDHRAPIVSIQVWYKVGSSYETNGVTGISHILEHMMFKGTQKHPPEELDKIITGFGGELNAVTSYDATHYLTTIAAPLLPTVFELEADRMQHLVLNAEGFAKELKVVQEERLMRTDNNPQTLTYERFMANAYLAVPYHHPVIGWMSDIQNTTLADLKSWYEQWYVPNNATIVVIGDVNANTIYQLAQKYFDAIPARALPTMKPHPEVPQIGQRYISVERPARLPWLVMGYIVPSLKTSEANLQWESYALQLVEAILSDNNSSRFRKTLIREQGIASSASASYDPYTLYESLFLLEGTPAASRTIDELKQALLMQIDKLKQELVSTDELQRIKNQFIAAQIYAKDSISSQANDIGTLASVGLPVELSETYINEIEKITPQQIRDVAQKYFTDQRLTIGELKPQPVTEQSQKNTPEPQGITNVHHQ